MVNNVKTQITNYIPSDFKLKNNIFVYRNNLGGVSIFYKGKNTLLTSQTESNYTIYGNNVLVELFNKSYLFFSDGEIYHN